MFKLIKNPKVQKTKELNFCICGRVSVLYSLILENICVAIRTFSLQVRSVCSFWYILTCAVRSHHSYLRQAECTNHFCQFFSQKYKNTLSSFILCHISSTLKLCERVCSSPCSAPQWSGVSAPPPAVTVAPASLSGSLRFTLSLEPKWTRLDGRELRSGDVSDSPGRSSALVGVTVKRTDAMAAHLEKLVGGGGRCSRVREG